MQSPPPQSIFSDSSIPLLDAVIVARGSTQEWKKSGIIRGGDLLTAVGLEDPVVVYLKEASLRGCATCAELELLLEKTADDHWNLVLQGSSEAEPEQAKALKQQVRAAKVATDEALAEYKRHLEAAHSQAASSGR